VHRVARPHDRVAAVADGPQQRPQPSSIWSAPMRVMRVSRPGMRCRVERSHSAAPRRTSSGRPCTRSDCRRRGGTRRGRRRARGCARRSTACGPSSRTSRRWGVLTGERLLVAEQERLVAGPDVDLTQVGVGLGVHPGGPHEAQRPVDLVRELLVALPDRARRDELLVPGVHPVECGEAALGERPHEVEGGADWWYACTSRSGRDAGGGRRPSSLTMWPRNDGISSSPTSRGRPTAASRTGRRSGRPSRPGRPSSR
jgi:hypothetical protein